MDSPGWKGRLQVAYVLSIILIMLPCPVTQGAKILVVPVDGSHWINMEILVEELKLHGHNITVLYTSSTWYIKKRPDLYQSILIQGQQRTGQAEMSKVIQSLVEKSLGISQNGWTTWGKINLQNEMNLFLYYCHKLSLKVTAEIFENKTLLKQLENENFDLMLADPVFGIGPMLAYYLKVPLVYNVRWQISGEAHLTTAPSPPSYVPIPGSHFTDKMNFCQRTENLIQNLHHLVFSEFFLYPLYNEVCHRYLGPDIDIQTLLLRADVWLMRVDFVFEFPRPTMPNFVYIGGFQCKPARPLAAEFEEFVQSSGKHGLIVMSLGSIVSSLPMQITMRIAEAFAQVPQKVIWRYDGEIPPNIGSNTLLAKWIPQNDLLGHPNTRVFISHGGINGIYEAIYHGVPLIGMPLLFDQFDNLFRLESRGAAKVMNVATMHSTDLLQALNELINSTFYRDNMKKLSALHWDQPESPMERAVFWIEYVTRHKGAGHLRSECYRLPWYVYYCVDVMIFLLSVFLLVTVLVVVTLKKLCNIVRKKKQKNE
ncbi:UDP-glucuronosyltransferase 2C1-like [Pristis pectinata]|uniref:UDP-glucuronosyltransferase 2C1-like n=1 Tax=Pristis pectinata TaxID=685728 RepID=UPI00223D7F11|nr:UDP-glucuronosyltransferase 2C1-like [Pristis pectinata]XP_051896186.1 UDP-glucuronosyltransferase 2C1-like [Pristis pectinata]XP_051896187.1 UDP-glucuronosyltransferase 2C1-like [Pristis pectinata]XP_051896188.1 UDP-glucuronosyltransferase 2C1-like [Pristis pectinata]XP_051896190.1 UDP-glucuronosyltransferase 2C1-like [Pristis pectinata]